MKLPNWLNQIKWFIQRGKTGYADCDFWDLDSYICQIMERGLSDLVWKGVGSNLKSANFIDHMSVKDFMRSKTFRKIQDFFELHQLMMNKPFLCEDTSLRRRYLAYGILFIRNFRRLWD